MTKKKYTGYSVRHCFADILNNRVKPEEVIKIVSALRVPDLSKTVKELYRLKKKSGRGWQETIEEASNENRSMHNSLWELTAALLGYKSYLWKDFEWDMIMDLFRKIPIEQPRLKMAPEAAYTENLSKGDWQPPLPPEEVIEVYHDPKAIHKGSSNGAFVARLASNHRIYDVGHNIENAITELLLTLKSFNKPHNKGYYKIEIINKKDA